MLVKAKRDHYDYGPIRRIKEGNLYIVYATEKFEDKYTYAVIKANGSNEKGSEPDPLFFPAEVFEVVEDKVSNQWSTHELPEGSGDNYTSFPEFFSKEGFWYRLHDWNLEGSDYDIIRKYKKQYEKVYENLI